MTKEDIEEKVRICLVGGLKRGSKCLLNFQNPLEIPQELLVG